MALEHERRRIVDFLSAEKERLLPEIQRLGRVSSKLEAFVYLAEKFFETIDANLAARLAETVSTIGAISIDAASQRLNDLSKGLEATASLIRTVAANQAQIPRELYGLVSWFLEECSTIAPPPTYVLSISSDLSTLEFRQWLESLFSRPITLTRRRDLFPELMQAFTAEPFFFLLVPASMASMASCVDWPLLFHECVHAVEEVANVVGNLFPGLPRNWENLQLQAQAGDATAREALWTLELVCDFVASLIGGPAFLWRFLRRYFSLLGVFHQSFSHPTFDVRIHLLIDLLHRHGFDSQAAQAKLLLDDMVKDLGGIAALPPPPSLTASISAASQYEAKILGFDRARFEDTLQRRFRSKSASLLSDLLSKRPVVADPATLFTLVAFEQRAEEPIISSLLADFLRLDAAKSQFQKLGLEG